MSETVSIKKPKRVLHFSDGILEEFSEDEIDSSDVPPNAEVTVIDEKSMAWIPWLSYKTWCAGSAALAVCDYLGENLAYFFGITTPKYWYELEEYKKKEAEKLERQKQAGGWSEPVTNGSPILNPLNMPVTNV